MKPQMGGCGAIQHPRGGKLAAGSPGDDQRQGEVPPLLRCTPRQQPIAHAATAFNNLCVAFVVTGVIAPTVGLAYQVSTPHCNSERAGWSTTTDSWRTRRVLGLPNPVVINQPWQTRRSRRA
jgi:hypothetical protein